MKKIYLVILCAVWLLSACDVGVSRNVVAPAMPDVAQAGLTEQPPKVVTLAPEATVTESVVRATPTGEEAVPEVSAADQPWKDCTLTPGWVGCDPNAEKLAARLAFFNPNGPAVTVLDLGSDQGWQVAQKPRRLDWSPKGESLLVSLEANQYQIYGADGALIEEFSSEVSPRWQPDNSLGREGHVRSAEGSEAWLESQEDGRWRLHATPAGGAEQVFDLETGPSDRLYRLVGWVPGTGQVLGQVYTADNAAMLLGGRLFSLDTQSGERRDWEAYAPLDWRATFVWKPQSPVLAFVASGVAETGLPTLGMLDFGSGQLSYPLPEGVQVSGLDWQPDGAKLALAAAAYGQSEPAQKFAVPAIYLLDPASGEVRALTQPPDEARDDLPHFTPDGSVLLYARRFDAGVMEVHALQLAVGKDWVILSGLPAACEMELGCDWQSWVAIK